MHLVPIYCLTCKTEEKLITVVSSYHVIYDFLLNVYRDIMKKKKSLEGALVSVIVYIVY